MYLIENNIRTNLRIKNCLTFAIDSIKFFHCLKFSFYSSRKNTEISRSFNFSQIDEAKILFPGKIRENLFGAKLKSGWKKARSCSRKRGIRAR